MKIAAISSVKLGDIAEGSLKNNYLYQGDYSELDNDIGWYDFALRSYDAQLGRFWQSDPYDQFSSPFTGMGNDPLNMTDPSGGWVSKGLFEGLSNVAKIGVTTFTGAIVGLAVDLISGGDGTNGALLGAGVGFLSNFYNYAAISIGFQVGNIILSDASKEFKNQYNEAITYLKKHKADFIIKRANRQQLGKIYIKQTTESVSWLDKVTNTVYWNPLAGAVFFDGNPEAENDYDKQVFVSPATLLSHELDHALMKIKRPKKFKKLINIKDSKYSQLEDKRVINGSEQKVARRTKELGDSPKTRNSHSGIPNITLGPSSNIDIDMK